MSTKSELEALQSDVAARLEGDAIFYDVHVSEQRPRANLSLVQIKEAADNALKGLIRKQGKAGVVAQVLLPLADVDKPNVSGPPLKLSLTIRVVESPTVNMGTGGTGKSAEAVALRALQLCHLWAPVQGRPLASEKEALTPVPNDDGFVVYEVRLFQACPLQHLSRVAPPQASVTDGNVTLSGSEGATIRYTTDGSYPVPTSPTYSAPIGPLEAGTIVRAVAWADGLVASDPIKISV